MPQHFLISPAARSLSIAQVIRLSDTEAFDTFKRIRFAANDGEPFCPHCGVAKVYTLAETPIRWKCSECRKKFSGTSGTLFHSRKLSIRDYLAVIALFTGGVKGVAALRMARDMNINPKSAFVLLHKLREGMSAAVTGGNELAGEVEVDGAYFGSRIRPPNRVADRRQTGEYKTRGWDIAQRDAVMSEFLDVLRQSNPTGIGIALETEAWRAI